MADPGRTRRLHWRPIALAVGCTLALFVCNAPLREQVGLDDSYYVLQCSSLLADGDLDLRDDILRSGFRLADPLLLLTRTTPTGVLANEFSIGPALLWSPAYAGGALASLAGGATERWNPIERDALHALSFVLLAGVVVCLVLLGQRLESSSGLTAAVVAATVLGTPLLVYGTSDYTMSHLPGAFAAALWCASVLTLAVEPGLGAAVLAGSALGLCTVIRWQDAALGVLLIPALLAVRPLGRRLRVLFGAIAGWLLVASVQVHAWHLERGQWLVMPQGSGYVHWTRPEIFHALLSGRSGLLTWSPVFGLAILGLVLPWRLRIPRSWAWCALVALGAELYLSAAAADWWGGHAYGLRRMTSTVVLLPLGLVNLRHHLGRALAPLLVLCAAGGLVGAHLYSSGVEDLGVLFGAPPAVVDSSPPPDLVTDPTTARERAAHWPAPRWADYLDPDHSSAAGALTALGVLALLGALTVVGLRAAPPRPLILLLSAVALLIALLAHLRLGFGSGGDPEERLGYQRLVASWNAPPRQYDREAVERAASRPMPEGRAEAYQYLEAFLEYRGGDPGRAADLLGSLRRRGDPAAVRAVERAATVAARRALKRWIPSEVFRPSRGHPQWFIPLSPTNEPVTDVSMTIDPGAASDGGPFDLASIPLPDAPVRVRWDAPARFELLVGEATATGPVALGDRARLRVRLVLDRKRGVAEASIGGDRGSILTLPLPAGLPAPETLLLGRIREPGNLAAVFRGATYQDLVVVAGTAPRTPSSIWQNPTP